MLAVTDNCRGWGGDSRNRRPCWSRKAIQFGADAGPNNSPSVGGDHWGYHFLGCRCGAHLASDDQAAGSQYDPMQPLYASNVCLCWGIAISSSGAAPPSIIQLWGRCAFRPAGKGTRRRTARKRTSWPATQTAEAVTIRAGLWSRAHTADKRVLSWLGHRCLRIRTVCLERIPLGKRRFQASGRFAPPGGKPASRLAAPALSRRGRF